MVLAQDVTRGDGVVLISAGRQVTAEVISLLRRLEVTTVVLEGDLFASEEERIDHLRRQEQALDRRFSRVTDDPVLMGIRELLRHHLRHGRAAMPAAGDPVVDAVGEMMGPEGGGKS